MPSSRHPAAVHRTAAFEWVRLSSPPFPNKNTTRVGGVSVWSRIRESNPSTSVAALVFFVFVAEIVAEWILENWILGGRHLWRMPSLSVRPIGIGLFLSLEQPKRNTAYQKWEDDASIIYTAPSSCGNALNKIGDTSQARDKSNDSNHEIYFPHTDTSFVKFKFCELFVPS